MCETVKGLHDTNQLVRGVLGGGMLGTNNPQVSSTRRGDFMAYFPADSPKLHGNLELYNQKLGTLIDEIQQVTTIPLIILITLVMT